MGSLSRRGHHGNGPTSEGATGAERANTMIGLQIMMPAGSWPPVPVRASSRHIRRWGDSGHAGHIGGTAALDPLRTFYTTDRRSSNEWDPRMGKRREPETAQRSLRDVPMR